MRKLELLSPAGDMERLEKSLTGPHGQTFARRVFGTQEQTLLGLPWAEPPARSRKESAAANFAAKEAFLKAAGRGLGGFELAQIQVLRLESGAPYYALGPDVMAWMEAQQLTAHLTLTHEGEMALAFCLLEKR